jgi:hypothetical protein
MTEEARVGFLELIRSNISTHGHHISLVSGGPLPRFAYTIGVSQVTGFELVLAGASSFTAKEVRRIINEFARHLVTSTDQWSVLNVDVGSLGVFSVRTVHPSWASVLLLGALDFYGADEIRAVQILPDLVHRTVDVPDLGRPWSATAEPVWRWLHEAWEHAVPSRSVATTNLRALRGEPITEVARWEETEWEMFAGPGPDVSPAEVRVVPLGTLLGADSSLDVVTSLEIGHGLWRESASIEWHPWSRTV